MKYLYLFVILILVISCNNINAKSVITDDINNCVQVEAHLKELSCIPQDKPYTKKGKSFSQFCQETIQSDVSLNLKCLLQLNSCDQVDICLQNK